MVKYTILFVTLLISYVVSAYPIDGYKYTGIDRILYQYRVMQDSTRHTKLDDGALLNTSDIQLNLIGKKGGLPKEDTQLEKQLESIFRYLEPEYSVSVMDISDPADIRYAGLKETVGYQPGSVAKIIAAMGLFDALHKVYGDNWEETRAVLYNRRVRGNDFAIHDHHTIPIYDIKNDKYSKRKAATTDVFSLYEWLDHMFSVSNNGAASIVMREMLLVHIMGDYYECATQKEMDDVIADAGKSVLANLTEDLTNCVLESLDISRDEYRLGGFFTDGAEKHIPRQGGSTGTTLGLMKFMYALESGQVINERISLEIKRLMYITDRRIRYAASKSLDNDAVYFKSGSFYSFKPEPGYTRQNYAGNKFNYMNSVAIIEKQDSTQKKYMVALMSNVLKKNSANEHYALAKRIDELIASHE
jgi:hypothetical protein